MNPIIKRPNIIAFHTESRKDTKRTFPEILKAQNVCHGDIYAWESEKHFVQLTHDDVKSLWRDGRPWDFKPMHALYTEFIASIAHFEPTDRDYVLVYELDRESLTALCQRLGLGSALSPDEQSPTK